MNYSEADIFNALARNSGFQADLRKVKELGPWALTAKAMDQVAAEYLIKMSKGEMRELEKSLKRMQGPNIAKGRLRREARVQAYIKQQENAARDRQRTAMAHFGIQYWKP